jgi:hypothetical protein
MEQMMPQQNSPAMPIQQVQPQDMNFGQPNTPIVNRNMPMPSETKEKYLYIAAGVLFILMTGVMIMQGVVLSKIAKENKLTVDEQAKK